MEYTCMPARWADLVRIWEKNVENNPEEPAWKTWREIYLDENRTGRSRTYLVLADGEPVGEGTLLLSPDCMAIRGRLMLADGVHVGNVNALRIEKRHEGRGQISRMMRRLEQDARDMGLRRLTIGVEPAQARNIAIYHHWGYTKLVHTEVEDGAVVEYYQKEL